MKGHCFPSFACSFPAYFLRIPSVSPTYFPTLFIAWHFLRIPYVCPDLACSFPACFLRIPCVFLTYSPTLLVHPLLEGNAMLHRRATGNARHIRGWMQALVSTEVNGSSRGFPRRKTKTSPIPKVPKNVPKPNGPWEYGCFVAC